MMEALGARALRVMELCGKPVTVSEIAQFAEWNEFVNT